MTPSAEVEVVVRAGDWLDRLPDCEAVCRRAAMAALEVAGGATTDGAEACVALTDDAEIATLNRTFRGKDAPTNVLAFPAGEKPSGDAGRPWPLGDVVVAFETTADEAARDNKPLNWHLSHLIVHGILHLLGFDHQEAAEAERMECLETRILVMLGVDDPYDSCLDSGPSSIQSAAWRDD